MRVNTAIIQQRPILLWVPMMLSALVGAAITCFALWLIIADLRLPTGPMGHLAALLGGMLLVPSTLELLVAYGLWKLKPWAWWLGLILHGFGVALLTRGATGMELVRPYLLLIIAVLLVTEACLFVPQVRRAFSPDPKLVK